MRVLSCDSKRPNIIWCLLVKRLPIVVLWALLFGCSPKEGSEKYYYREGMNAFNNTNYYKAKDSFETLLHKYPASPYNSEVATKLAIAKRKVAEIEGEARKIKQTAMALSVLELMSNKTKYANEKVTIEGYIFSN